ncbi:MAG TPA: HD domain-containing phosphohydrolase [Mycobacteriales bacterium]|nr:HD domain-containing phosphohydrolase [Mycobacteriales bacterium]
MGPDEAAALAQAKEQLLVLARDVNAMYQSERERSRQLQEALDALQASYLATVRTLAFIVEAKDSSTREHLERTHDYARALARVVMPDREVGPELSYGFLLHDVGKVGIPESILCKPGPLTDEEYEVMKTHPLIGVQIVAPIAFLENSVEIIRCHHERWDGRGYPDGLAGEGIPLGARIFSVCDTFDAMTSDRPYRRALPFDDAVSEIERCGGTQFDPDVVASFVQMCDRLRDGSGKAVGA